jgi:hypothetical protein
LHPSCYKEPRLLGAGASVYGGGHHIENQCAAGILIVPVSSGVSMPVVRISKGTFDQGNVFEAERLLSESKLALDLALRALPGLLPPRGVATIAFVK